MTAHRAVSDATLRIVRVFPAARERVFDAFVDPDALRVWFCPPGFGFESIGRDPLTGRGTTFSMVETASGHRYVFDLDYTLVDRPREIRWTSTWREGFPEAGRRTFATIGFRDVPGGTEVTLVQEGFADEQVRDEHAQGWAGGLDKLEAYLA